MMGITSALDWFLSCRDWTDIALKFAPGWLHANFDRITAAVTPSA